MINVGRILYPLGFVEEPAADDGEFAFSYTTRRNHRFEFVIEADSDEQVVKEFEELYECFDAKSLAEYLGVEENIATIASADEIKSALKDALESLRVFI